MGEFALEECLLPRCYGSHGQRLRRAHRACTNAAVTSGVPVGRGRQLAVWIRPPVGRKRADVQDIAAHDEQQRRVGKPFAGDAFKFRSGAEEHWPYRRRCPPRQQVRSSRNDMFRQELHWATGPKLAGQLPQTGRTEQLSGAKNRTSNAVLLHHAVDGRHVSVSVIVLVKEHGLIQLQFEFASDIDTESHVDFSRLSRGCEEWRKGLRRVLFHSLQPGGVLDAIPQILLEDERGDFTPSFGCNDSREGYSPYRMRRPRYR